MTATSGGANARRDDQVDEGTDVEHLGYADAVAELEAILGRIEDDTVDIDQLSREVRRAAALIRLCQERISGARLEVERVVADLEAGIDLGTASAAAGGADDDLDGAGTDATDG